MEDKQKVYIKGVPCRGEEVVKVLTDLGGEDVLFNAENENCVYFINHKGEIDYEYTDTETAKLIMDNYREIQLPNEEWNDGDILISRNETCYKIFSAYGRPDTVTAFYAYNVSISLNGTITQYDDGIWICDKKDYRLATSSEVKRFYELLHASNKDWDADMKQIINWRWTPKSGETYYFINETGEVASTEWINLGCDVCHYQFGNCFKTKEEAEIAANRVKKVLKGK